MKKILSFVACAFIIIALTSCGGSQKGKKTDQKSSEKVEEVAENQSGLLEEDYNDAVSTINEIENGLQSIRDAEGIMLMDMETTDQKQKVVAELMQIKEVLAQNRAKIADLESKLANSRANNAALNAQINKLKAELEEKDARIAELEKELASRNIVIDELYVQVDSLNTGIEDLNVANAQQYAIIEEQNEEINQAYYCIATLKELKKAEIVTNAGLFKGKDVLKKEFVASKFKKADKRRMKTMPLNGKKAKVLSSHPEGSYRIKTDKDGFQTLEILNSDKFWNVSDYLVVSIK